MKELDKALDIAERISAKGQAREEALAGFRKQMAEWEFALPDVEPLIWDFGLGDFFKIGMIEIWIANEIEAGYCAKYLFLFDGQRCPTHHHKTKVETFFIVKGKVRMECHGDATEMNPGDVLLVDAGTNHGFTAIGPAILLEVSKPCFIDDNCFQDARIPVGKDDKAEQR